MAPTDWQALPHGCDRFYQYQVGFRYDRRGHMGAASEHLNIEDFVALEAYLRRERRLDAGEQVSFRTLGGGVSNRTVLVERSGGDNWVLKQALAKLRVAVDWFSSPERIHREALVRMGRSSSRDSAQIARDSPGGQLCFESFTR